jgi:CxxC motif-containing protein
MTTEVRELTCIRCPVGCPLRLEHEGDKIIEISGNECKRGAKYARQEFVEPRRALSTTVAVVGSRWERLPVKTVLPVRKERQLEAAREIHRLRVRAPVRMGQVLIEDLLGERGVDVVATRSLAVCDNA